MRCRLHKQRQKFVSRPCVDYVSESFLRECVATVVEDDNSSGVVLNVWLQSVLQCQGTHTVRTVQGCDISNALWPPYVTANMNVAVLLELVEDWLHYGVETHSSHAEL